MTDISYYLSLPYTKVLKRDDEGDVIATVAELDGCMAHGGDESEALRNLTAAQADWLEAAIIAGQDIPVPEIEEDLPSGKFVVRIPRSLHQKLNKLAKKDDVSLNQLVVMAATEHVARREGRSEAMRSSMLDLAAWHARPMKWSTAPTRARAGEYLERLKERGMVEEVEHHAHPQSRSKRG